MEARFLDLDRPLDPQEIEEVTGRVGYASEDLRLFRVDPGRPGRVWYQLAPGADEARSRAVLAEVIAAVRGRVRRGRTRVLWESRQTATPRGEVRGDLVHRGLLAELGRGQVALGGELLLLAEGLDRAVLGMARAWSPRRYDYPTLIPLEVLVRARYLENFPQYMTFACHLREDLEVLRQIVLRSSPAAAPNTTPGAGAVAGCEHLGRLDHVLSPAVCLHAYQQLAGTRFAKPLCIAARARCARYEGAALGGPERLWDFTMREIIFLGPPDWVASERERALALAVDLVEKLGLSGRATTATDAFFVDGHEKRAAFQRAFDTKYELRLDLPASEGTLAVASFNLHHDHFARSFDLSLEGGAALATGCVGFGLERFAYAVACQHGPDPEAWPEAARELVSTADGPQEVLEAALEDIP